MNKIISSEYFEYRCNNYLNNRTADMKRVNSIDTKYHKTLIKTKEIHKLDNNVEIAIMNIKNAIYSNDLKIKIKLDYKKGYEFIIHMYNLNDNHMVREEPIYIGDVDKHCVFEVHNNIIDIGLSSLAYSSSMIIKDVYNHKITISGVI